MHPRPTWPILPWLAACGSPLPPTDSDTDVPIDSEVDTDTDTDTDIDTDTVDTDTDAVDGWSTVTAVGLVGAGGPPGAQVQRLAAAGDVVLAATYQGLWVSSDGGLTWGLPADGAVATTRIQAVAATATAWFAGTDSGPLRSTDAGATWTKTTTGLGNVNIQGFGTDGADVYALTGGSSANAYRWDATTWRALGGTEPFTALFADGDDLTASSSFGSGIFASDDHGASFAELGADSLPFGVWNAVRRYDATLIVADQTSMYRHTGTKWAAVTSPPKDTRAFAAWGTTWVAATWGDGPHASTDGGATWKSIPTGLPLGWGRNLTSMAASTSALVVAPYGYVPYVSTDANTWRASTGIAATTPVGIAFDGTAIVAAGTADVWTWDGAVWAASAKGIDAGAQITAVAADGGVWVAGSKNGVWRSIDRGASWAAVSGIPTYNGTAGTQKREVAAITAASGTWLTGFGSSTEMISGTFTITGGGIARSTDGGASWKRVNTGLASLSTSSSGERVYPPVTALRIVDGVALAAAGESFRSADLGDTWSRLSLPVNIADFAALDGVLYAAGPGAWRSTDDGETWTEVSTGLPPKALVTGLDSHDGALFCVVKAPGGGVYRLDADRWTKLTAGGDAWIGAPLRFDGEELWVGSVGKGLWELHPDPS